MPSAITDVPQWETLVVDPNNGESADAPSLRQFTQKFANRTSYLYEHHFRGNFQAEKYGAVGSGAVNDYPAIEAAVAAAVAAGGGTIWLRSGGRYRLDSPLMLTGTVCLRAQKGAGSAETALIRNHPFHLLRVDNAVSSDNETPTLIEGVTFTDAVGAPGPMFEVWDGSVDLVRCALLGVAGVSDNTYPLVFVASEAGSKCRLSRCFLAPVNGQNAILAHTGGLVAESGTVIKVPATYSGDLIKVDSSSPTDPALISLSGGFDFDATAHTTGNIICVNAEGDAWSVSADGCFFRGGSSNTITCFYWPDSNVRRLNVGAANVYSGILNRYFPAGTAPLTNESCLALKPYLAFDAPGTTYTLPTGVEAVAVRFQSTAPTLTMPPKLFAGQRMRVAVFNNSGSAWAGVTVIGLLFGGTNAINNVSGRSFEAVVVDRNLDGVLDWVIVGGWSEMYL